MPDISKNTEFKAQPSDLKVGDFVRWGSSGGTARGKVTSIQRNGKLKIADSGVTIVGTRDNPAALIRVFRKSDGKWSSTKSVVGHRFTALTKIKALEEKQVSAKISAIKSIDEEKRIVYGLVYEPNVLDSHGDMMTAEEIEKMAHKFMAITHLDKTIDVNHDGVAIDAQPVESYIAKSDDPHYSEGSWVLGVKINDEAIWHDVKTGELNGFSFEALVLKYPTVVEYEFIRNNFGETEKANNHTHLFFAELNEDGTVVRGRTSTDHGHSHEIAMGTATQEGGSDGHKHRFFVE